MNRDPVQIMLQPIHAGLLREVLVGLMTPETSTRLFLDTHPLHEQVLKDVLRQVQEDLTRPCIECTQQELDTKLPRQEVILLLSTIKPDDERWVRRDIKVQGLVGERSDPTVNYQLVCGHWVIDL